MKTLRLLICLSAALTLAMPPLAAKAATPQALHDGMDCPHSSTDTQRDGAAGSQPGDHHHDGSTSLAQNCCPSAPFGWAVLGLAIAAGHAAVLDRSPAIGRALAGLTFTKDPPPPRV